MKSSESFIKCKTNWWLSKLDYKFIEITYGKVNNE